MASSQQIYLAGEVALWLQRQCGDPWEFLGCHNMTGISVPRGDSNPVYCRVGKNQFKVQRTWKGTPGLGGATLVAYDSVLNYLQEIPCAFNLITLLSAKGSDDDPTNYDYGYYYNGVELSSVDTDTAVVGMNPDDQTPIMLSMPVTFQERVKFKDLDDTVVDVTSLTTNRINAVSVCDDPSCDSFGNLSTLGCQTIFMVTNGTTAKILKATDGGTFSAISSPFTDADDNIVDVACMDDTVIVVNGTTVGTYAYSWDAGTAWSVIGTGAKLFNGVFMLSPTKIWFYGQDGYIYYSSNRGASISLQDAGSATSQSLNDMSAADSLLLYAVGDSNAFIRTEDGGTIWSAVTGPAAAIFPNDLYKVLAIPGTDIVFVGDEQGNVYRSADKGDNWSTVLTNTNLAGGIRGLVACDCNIIMVAGNDSDPYFYASGVVGYVYQSVDGGNTWQGVEVSDTNTGLFDLVCCDVNQYWAVGEDGFATKIAGPVITTI